jgi:hypothetical protein
MGCAVDVLASDVQNKSILLEYTMKISKYDIQIFLIIMPIKVDARVNISFPILCQFIPLLEHVYEYWARSFPTYLTPKSSTMRKNEMGRYMTPQRPGVCAAL